MKLVCGYSDLITALNEVLVVVDDSMEDMKIVIFKLSENGTVKLIGLNHFVVLRRMLLSEKLQVEGVDGEPIYFAIKSKELSGFLNSYKSIRKTKVEEVIFETTKGGAIECKVIEKMAFTSDELSDLMYQEGGEEKINRTMLSSWIFDKTIIKPTVYGTIEMAASEDELTSFESQMIQLHTQNMLPVMQDGTNSYSYLLFDEENVVAMNQAFTVVMKNQIAEGGIFSDIRLSYKSILFLDKLAIINSYIDAAKLEQYIYIKTDTSEAFIKYDTKKVSYKTFTDVFKKDHVVTLDRMYLKDVLKRFALSNDTIEANIKPDMNVVTMSNTKYSQDLDIGYQRGMDEFPSVKFKIMPGVMSTAIIGVDEKFILSDTQFGGDVFIYYCMLPKGSVIVFADASGGWFTVARVKTY